MLLELPRFKGLDRGCIFHGVTDRLTLHYCDDHFPLRLTKKYTHLADFPWDSKHLQLHALGTVLINICWKILNVFEKILVSLIQTAIKYHITEILSETVPEFNI